MKVSTIQYLLLILFVIVTVALLHDIVLRFAISKFIGDENYRSFLMSRQARLMATKQQQEDDSDVTTEAIEKFRLPDRFLINDLTFSPHNYKFVIQPAMERVCSESTYLVVAIASALWEFERRQIIRETWASNKMVENKYVRYVFFVAHSDKNDNYFERLTMEVADHDDVVMENFEETYKNLTLKTQGQLKWVSEFCANAAYAIHVDDDVFVDVTSVVRYTMLKEGQRRLIGCSKVFQPVVRREGKWEMSLKEYPFDRYPESCVGWCFVLSQEVARELYLMSLVTHLLHLEDVTFTGILREKVGNVRAEEIPRGGAVCQHLGWPKTEISTNDKLRAAWWKHQTDHN